MRRSMLWDHIDVPSDTPESQTTMYEDVGDMFAGNYETFVNKNLSYGNTFVINGLKSYVDNPERYESPRTAAIEELMVRLGDKRARVKNLVLGGGEDRVGENVAETASDAAVYYTMVQWLATIDDETFMSHAVPTMGMER